MTVSTAITLDSIPLKLEMGCQDRGHQIGNPLFGRATRANVHTSSTSPFVPGVSVMV
jgi:hypothetical protein